MKSFFFSFSFFFFFFSLIFYFSFLLWQSGHGSPGKEDGKNKQMLHVLVDKSELCAFLLILFLCLLVFFFFNSANSQIFIGVLKEP